MTDIIADVCNGVYGMAVGVQRFAHNLIPEAPPDNIPPQFMNNQQAAMNANGEIVSFNTEIPKTRRYPGIPPHGVVVNGVKFNSD